MLAASPASRPFSTIAEPPPCPCLLACSSCSWAERIIARHGVFSPGFFTSSEAGEEIIVPSIACIIYSDNGNVLAYRSHSEMVNMRSP